MPTIAETFHLHSAADIRTFLNRFLSRYAGLRLTMPSGHVVTVGKDSAAPYMYALSEHLEELLPALPYLNTLPTVRDLIALIPADGDPLAFSQRLRTLSSIYTVFSSPPLTGHECAPREIIDYVAENGELLCWLAPDDRVKIVIPEEITAIASHAFYGCPNALHLVLHERFDTLSGEAFYCDELFDDPRLTFIEITSPDTRLLSPPLSGAAEPPFEECFRWYVIAPENARAVLDAKPHGGVRQGSVEGALLDFLDIAQEFESIRQEAGSYGSVADYFDRARRAADYGLRTMRIADEIALSYARIAFSVSSAIHQELFDAREAAKLLVCRGLAADYLAGQSFSWGERSGACVRALAILSKTPGFSLGEALPELNALDVSEYLLQLYRGRSYDVISANMFYDTSEDAYGEGDFFSLAQDLAALCFERRLPGRDEVLEMSRTICEDMNDEARFGCFDKETVDRWAAM